MLVGPSQRTKICACDYVWPAVQLAVLPESFIYRPISSFKMWNETGLEQQEGTKPNYLFLASYFTRYFTACFAFLAFLAFAILKTSTVTFRAHRRQLPPGPPTWPLLGNLPDLGKFAIGTLRTFSQRYGGLCLVYFGSMPVVLVSSAEMAKEVLQKNDHITASRPLPPVSARFFSYNRLDILWSPYGSYWRNLRKICSLRLFTPHRLHLFQKPRRTEMLHTLLDILKAAQQGKPVNMRASFSNLTYNNMTAIVLGKRLRHLLHTDAVANKDNYAVEMFQRGIEMAVRINISDVLPWLRPFDLQGIEKACKSIQSEVDQYFQAILDEHKATSERSSMAKEERLSGNFVDLLLDISAGLSEDFSGVKLSESNIKAILGDVMGASIETSTYGMEWTLAELLKHPETLKRVQGELDVVVGRHRLVNEADLPQLTYLQAVIKESLRLHPPVPLTVPRETMADCSIAGYSIPSNTRMCINLYALHRDPAVWARPLEFDPDRFLGSKVDVLGRNFECLPFGAGRRACPAMNLALLQLQHSLAQILHTFDWSLPDGQSPESFEMSEAGLFTHFKANPLTVLPKERIPPLVIYDAARDLSQQ